MAASAEFRLSITRALGDQLAEGLDRLDHVPLDSVEIAKLDRRSGIYQLYEDGVLVYVGKADRSLPTRLRKHQIKLSGRLNVGAMRFTCLYVDEDLPAVAPERILIDRYKEQDLAHWNFNGFGSNDPGQNRDQTVFEAEHFDSSHPINLDVRLDGIPAGTYQADELLKRVKADLPYVFRYEGARFHKDIEVELPEGGLTAAEMFLFLAEDIARVDSRWRIVALPGYVIMYPKPGEYPSAQRIYP